MKYFARSSTAFVIVGFLSIVSGITSYYAFGTSPKIVVPTNEIELGLVPLGMSSKHELQLTNQGTAALRISSLHSDCGCLRAVVDRDSVSPGEKFTVKIEADGVRLTPRVVQYVRIFSNAPGSPHTLSISHECVPEKLTVQPQQVSFGRIEMNDGPHIRSCRVFSPEDEFHGEVRSSNADVFTAKLAEPGRLEVRFAPKNLCGGIRECIDLVDGDTSVRLPVTAFAVGPLFASPASLVVDGESSVAVTPEAMIKARSEINSLQFGPCSVSPDLQGLMTPSFEITDNGKAGVLRLSFVPSASRSLSSGNRFQFVDLQFSVEERGYRLRLPVELR